MSSSLQSPIVKLKKKKNEELNKCWEGINRKRLSFDFGIGRWSMSDYVWYYTDEYLYFVFVIKVLFLIKKFADYTKISLCNENAQASFIHLNTL